MACYVVSYPAADPQPQEGERGLKRPYDLTAYKMGLVSQ